MCWVVFKREHTLQGLRWAIQRVFPPQSKYGASEAAKKISRFVAKNRYVKKKIKNVIGIIHLHHCLSRDIK